MVLNLRGGIPGSLLGHVLHEKHTRGVLNARNDALRHQLQQIRWATSTAASLQRRIEPRWNARQVQRRLPDGTLDGAIAQFEGVVGQLHFYACPTPRATSPPAPRPDHGRDDRSPARTAPTTLAGNPSNGHDSPPNPRPPRQHPSSARDDVRHTLPRSGRFTPTRR